MSGYERPTASPHHRPARHEHGPPHRSPRRLHRLRQRRLLGVLRRIGRLRGGRIRRRREAHRRGGGGHSSATTDDRSVVTTGNLDLLSSDPIAASHAISAVVTGAGGHVQSLSEQPKGPGVRRPHGAHPLGGLRLDPDRDRAPREDALGQRPQPDVTSQVTDYGVRIANLRTSIARLQTLLRATDTGALVEIESSLTTRQTDLKQLLAQQKDLADQVSYATLGITVESPALVGSSGPGTFVAGFLAGGHRPGQNARDARRDRRRAAPVGRRGRTARPRGMVGRSSGAAASPPRRSARGVRPSTIGGGVALEPSEPEASAPSDRVLLAAAGRAAEPAFKQVLQRHSGVVYAVAFRQVGTVADAEELVQDAFVLLWTKRARLRFVGESALPWLIVTVKHLAANRRRAMQRRQRHEASTRTRPRRGRVTGGRRLPRAGSRGCRSSMRSSPGSASSRISATRKRRSGRA